MFQCVKRKKEVPIGAIMEAETFNGIENCNSGVILQLGSLLDTVSSSPPVNSLFSSAVSLYVTNSINSCLKFTKYATPSALNTINELLSEFSMFPPTRQIMLING